MSAQPRNAKLATFMREVYNWPWDKFVKAEKDKNFSSSEAIVFGVVRACAMQKMDAIRISLQRIDGKLKTPLNIEMPKVFYRYPNAKFVEGGEPVPEPVPDFEKIAPGADAPKNEALTGEIVHLSEPEAQVETEEDLEKMGLRETLDKMSDFPRELPEAITELATQVEQAIRNQTPIPENPPRVKSVVAAHLLVMAQNRNIDALYEVFDQIDGKLAETLQILGPGESNEIFIDMFVSVAPAGAIPGPDGVLQMEAEAAQADWAEKLKKEGKK